MSKRIGVTLLLGTVAFGAAFLTAPSSRCEAQMFPQSITEEDRAVVQAVIDQEAPADRITSELIELLVSEQWGVREAAAQELMGRELAERDLNRLETIVLMVPFDSQGGDVSVLTWPGMNVGSREAWEVLAHAKTDGRPVDEQVEWYVTQFRYTHPLDNGRAAAASPRLVEIGEPAVPRLIRATDRESTWAQHWAALTLEQIGTEEAMDAVESWALRVLEETDDPFVLQNATYSLGRLRSEAGFEPLERLLEPSLEERWSWAIIDSLVQIDPERAREPLRRILEEHQPEAGRRGLVEPYLRSARHLAALGEERGWTALETAVHSPVPEVRRELASALSATWDPRARESLVTLTQDENEQVASAARYQLDNLDRELKRQNEQQQ